MAIRQGTRPPFRAKQPAPDRLVHPQPPVARVAVLRGAVAGFCISYSAALTLTDRPAASMLTLWTENSPPPHVSDAAIAASMDDFVTPAAYTK